MSGRSHRNRRMKMRMVLCSVQRWIRVNFNDKTRNNNCVIHYPKFRGRATSNLMTSLLIKSEHRKSERTRFIENNWTQRCYEVIHSNYNSRKRIINKLLKQFPYVDRWLRPHNAKSWIKQSRSCRQPILQLHVNNPFIKLRFNECAWTANANRIAETQAQMLTRRRRRHGKHTTSVAAAFY